MFEARVIAQSGRWLTLAQGVSETEAMYRAKQAISREFYSYIFVKSEKQWMITEDKLANLINLVSDKNRSQFPDRTRFNWGYHDAAFDFRNGTTRKLALTGEHTPTTVSREWDEFYFEGYKRGVHDVSVGQYRDSSGDAWCNFVEGEVRGDQEQEFALPHLIRVLDGKVLRTATESEREASKRVAEVMGNKGLIGVVGETGIELCYVVETNVF
jgi:hypothetical protein